MCMNFEVSLRKVENYQRILKATIIIVKNMQRCERILKSALETMGKKETPDLLNQQAILAEACSHSQQTLLW